MFFEKYTKFIAVIVLYIDFRKSKVIKLIRNSGFLVLKISDFFEFCFFPENHNDELTDDHGRIGALRSGKSNDPSCFPEYKSPPVLSYYYLASAIRMSHPVSQNIRASFYLISNKFFFFISNLPEYETSLLLNY